MVVRIAWLLPGPTPDGTQELSSGNPELHHIPPRSLIDESSVTYC